MARGKGGIGMREKGYEFSKKFNILLIPFIIDAFWMFIKVVYFVKECK